MIPYPASPLAPRTETIIAGTAWHGIVHDREANETTVRVNGIVVFWHCYGPVIERYCIRHSLNFLPDEPLTVDDAPEPENHKYEPEHDKAMKAFWAVAAGNGANRSVERTAEREARLRACGDYCGRAIASMGELSPGEVMRVTAAIRRGEIVPWQVMEVVG